MTEGVLEVYLPKLQELMSPGRRMPTDIVASSFSFLVYLLNIFRHVGGKYILCKDKN
jgi:hypothetical protein